jgi:hypothetical protein
LVFRLSRFFRDCALSGEVLDLSSEIVNCRVDTLTK